LLFAHWPADPANLPLPSALEHDLFEGAAWVAVVPFRMSGIRARWLPPLPGLSAFPELNLRTYVRPRRGEAKPGVYFWSLEAANPIAVVAARAWFHLPYMNAEMHCRERDGWIDYASRRMHRGEPTAVFRGRYRPLYPMVRTPLTDFLTERYCLYSSDANGRLRIGEIHHRPWPLYSAQAEIEENTIAATAGIGLQGPPLLHFARFLEVAIWAPRPIAPP
jgi:hypothetical protein